MYALYFEEIESLTQKTYKILADIMLTHQQKHALVSKV